LNQFYGFSGFFTRKENSSTGMNDLKKNPAMMERDPSPRQIKCSPIVRGTVLTAYPPNSTHAI
jgi:hypothetical protein